MKIIECPRDAMQGIQAFIPTENKIRYINQLLKVGFDTIDFGSFVSSKAVPQMKDTSAVLEGIQLDGSNSKLLAIVANKRGAEEAVIFNEISYLGFPLSISETFQQRNTKKSIVEALNEIETIRDICDQNDKELIVYLSMGFGNPYGDLYNSEIVVQFCSILETMGVNIISLADTVGAATPNEISSLFSLVKTNFAGLELGVHLHSNPMQAHLKIEAAYDAGCRRFDGAIKGFGGCPFAEDELVGNIPTEAILTFLNQKEALSLNKEEFSKSMSFADAVFPTE